MVGRGRGSDPVLRVLIPWKYFNLIESIHYELLRL